jgi:hypothetical protein
VKKRSVIAAADWRKVIDATGQVTDPHQEEFAYLLATTGAVPQVLVQCERTAWVPRTPLESTRITLDEAIVGYPWRGDFFDLDPRHATPIDGEDAHARAGRQAILELKFTDGAPGWMRDLVQRFGLARTTYSKFCAAMRVLDPATLAPLALRIPLARAERRADPDEWAVFPS